MTTSSLAQLARDQVTFSKRLAALAQAVKQHGTLRESAHASSHARRLEAEHVWAEGVDRMLTRLFERVDLDEAISYARSQWVAPPADPSDGKLTEATVRKSLRQWFQKSVRTETVTDADVESVQEWGGSRAALALEALDERNIEGRSIFIQRDAQGRPTAVASYTLKQGKLTVNRVAAAPGEAGIGANYGSAIMQELAGIAAREGAKVELTSSLSAQGFYEKLGMVKDGGKYSWTHAEALQFARTGGYAAPSIAAIQDSLILGMTQGEFVANAAVEYLQLVVNTHAGAGQSALEHMGLNKTFAWANPRTMANDLFAVRGSKVIQNLYGTHMADLSKMILEATDPRSPKTVQQVKQQIQERWPQLKSWQAARIARTETAAVWTTTAVNAYAANGITEFESLIAQGPSIPEPGKVDAQTGARGACAECVWKAQAVHSIFDDLPPWHPNCRCEAVPVLEDRFGDPWLPPDEPWTGGGPLPPQTAISAMIPAPSGAAKYHTTVPDQNMKNALNTEIGKWQPNYGDVDSSPLKEQARQMVSSGKSVTYSMDESGKLTSIGSFSAPDDASYFLVGGIVAPEGGASMLLGQMARQAHTMGRDLLVDTTGVSLALKGRLEQWGAVQFGETGKLLHHAKLKSTFKIADDEVAITQISTEGETLANSLPDLKAALTSTNNKISGMKTRLKKEQANLSGGDPVKIAEIQTKLDNLLAERESIKLKIKNWNGSAPVASKPKAPATPVDPLTLSADVMSQSPKDILGYIRGSGQPEGTVFRTASATAEKVGGSLYVPGEQWNVFVYRDIVMKVEGPALGPGSLGAAMSDRIDDIKKSVDRTLELNLKGQEKLEHMVWAKGRSPNDAHWEKEFNQPGFQAGAQGGNGGIWVWGSRRGDDHLLDHELGHIIGAGGSVPDSTYVGTKLYSRAWDQAQDADARWSAEYWSGLPSDRKQSFYMADIQVGKTGVTTYGSNNQAEDWAESVRLWIRDHRNNGLGELTDGTRVYFEDLFPSRAKRLEEFTGLKSAKPPPPPPPPKLIGDGETGHMLPGGATKEKGTKILDGAIAEQNRGYDGAREAKRLVSRRVAEKLRQNSDWSATAIRDKYRYSEHNYDADDIHESMVANLIHEWAISSSDSHARGVAMQIAAQEEFGLSVKAFAAGAYGSEERAAALFREAEEWLDQPGIRSSLRAFLRAQYDTTQDYLKSQGIESLTLYRGMRWEEDWNKDVPIGVTTHGTFDNPLASWATRHSSSRYFYGGVMLRGQVPREMVLSTPFSGFGCLNEYEVVLINTGRNISWVSRAGVKRLSNEEREIFSKERADLEARIDVLRDEQYRVASGSPEYYEKKRLYLEANGRLQEVNDILSRGGARWEYTNEQELIDQIKKELTKNPELAGVRTRVKSKPSERGASTITPEKRAYNRITSTRAQLKKTLTERDTYTYGSPTWQALDTKAYQLQTKLEVVEAEYQALKNGTSVALAQAGELDLVLPMASFQSLPVGEVVDLRAQLTTANNKLSGMRTRLKREEVGSPKSLEIQTRLDELLAEREAIRAKIASSTLQPVKETLEPKPEPPNPELVYNDKRYSAEPLPDGGKLAPDEYNALKAYVSSTWMSGAMRKGSTPKEVPSIDNVMSRSELKKAGMAYRGVRDPSAFYEALGVKTTGGFFNRPLDPDFKPQDIIGLSYREPGYISTTLDREVLEEFSSGGGIKLEVRVPKGAHAVYIPKTGVHEYESELLLERDLTMRVVDVKVKKKADGWEDITVVTEVVPSPKASFALAKAAAPSVYDYHLARIRARVRV